MTAATLTLTEFLLARIAEDEAVAQAVMREPDPLQWGPVHFADRAWRMDGPVDGPSGYSSIVIDPARVLAECEAKRRIVAEECATIRDFDDPVAQWLRDSVLELLALPYADHPDYREDWRP